MPFILNELILALGFQVRPEEISAQFDFVDFAPACPTGPDFFFIYFFIIVAIVAIIVAGLVVNLASRNQASKQGPSSGGIKEQTFAPSSPIPYSYQTPSATPPPRPSSSAISANLCPLCGAICRPGDEFCMNCGAHLKSVQ